MSAESVQPALVRELTGRRSSRFRSGDFLVVIAFLLLAVIVLCALNIVFWGVYEQQGNTIQLFADRNTDWHIFGWEMPSTWFQAINPMFIFVVTPLLNMLWTWQSARRSEPMSVSKMGIGCLLLLRGC